MYDFLVKRGEMVAFGLGLLLVIIYLVSALGNLEAFNALPEEIRNTSDAFDIGLWIGIGLFVITAVVALFFGFLQFITNPKGSIKVLAGLAVVAIIFGIFYATAEPETTGALGKTIAEFKITDNVSKIITAGIKTVIGLSAVSAAVFIFGELYNAFK